jgi:hypothetical protein
MALSILTFILLESQFLLLPFLIAMTTILIRPQTAVPLFLCFWLYQRKGLSSRLPSIIPALVGLKLIGVKPKVEEALWRFRTYANSLFPAIRYPVGIFGFLCPSCLFCIFDIELLERLVGPLLTFYILCVVSLQQELRFNFFGLLATVVPLIATIALSAFHRFGRRWKSQEAQGIVNCAIVLSVVVMCLSSLAGIWARLGQKFDAWDADCEAIGKWIIKNTRKNAVFASTGGNRWNPAVMIAGRAQFIPLQPTLQSAEYNADNRAEALSEFLEKGVTIPDVHYFMVEKGSSFEATMKAKTDDLVTLVYDNSRYQLFERRQGYA